MANDTIRVLLVDDDQGDFEMIRVMLSKSEHQDFQVDWVSTFEEAMDAFDARRHDVYFLDYFLEDRTGLDLLREARERGIEAPIIMLTGRGSRAVDMEAMELGASDYLVKGLIDPDALERSVRHALERMEGNRAMKERERPGREAPPTSGTPATVPPTGSSDPGPGAASSSPGAASSSPGAASSSPGAASLSPGAASREGQHGDAARFWALFDSVATGVGLLSLDGTVARVNQPFAEAFSQGTRILEGASFVDLLEEADREAVARELEVLGRGERTKFEAARRFTDQEGKVLWAHLTSILIRSQEGEPDHLMVLLDPAGEEV